MCQTLKNKYLILFLVSNFLIFLDQCTKFLVITYIPKNHTFPVIDKFFALTHVRNTGVAFSWFAEYNSDLKTWALIGFSIIAITAILVFFHQAPRHRKLIHWGLILVFSGAVGNFIDRIAYKEVVDWLAFFLGGYHFPIFNVADSCITIGVGIMFIDLFKNERFSRPPKTPDMA